MPRLNISAPDFQLRRRATPRASAPACSASARGSARRPRAASVYELPPGQAICPYHYEYGEEEWLLVLEGRPTLRTPEGEEEIGSPGTWSSSRPGPEGAHAVRNETDATVRVLMFSTVTHPAVDGLSGQRQDRHLDRQQGRRHHGSQDERRRLLGRRGGHGGVLGLLRRPRARRYRSMRVSASGEASRTRAQSRSRGPGSPSPSSHRPCASRRGVLGAVR